jgi:hypothetical protein
MAPSGWGRTWPRAVKQRSSAAIQAMADHWVGSGPKTADLPNRLLGGFFSEAGPDSLVNCRAS